MITLTIGSKAYSSWSLRPWLVAIHFKIDVIVKSIPFRTVDGTRRLDDETLQKLADASPSSLVPVLHVGETAIWDSMAICEYLAEANKTHRLWPRQAQARGVARAVSAEMHSGFSNLRGYLPFCAKARVAAAVDEHLPEAVKRDVRRIEKIWDGCMSQSAAKGPFLFGQFTIADAMFAPVALRFHTYRIHLSPVSQRYVEAILGLPATQEWINHARTEPDIIAPIDRLVGDFAGNVANIRLTEQFGSTAR